MHGVSRENPCIASGIVSVMYRNQHRVDCASLCGSRRAAELLGVHVATITRLVKRGTLKPVPLDGPGPLVFEVADVLVLRDSLEAAS